MATTSSSKRQLVHTSNTYQSNSDLTVGGDLLVSGSTTTIDTANLLVEDKNVILGNVSSPSDTTADGGGITLKGASDYTINWTNSTNSWHFNQGITVGANGTGHDVVFYGDTSDRYMTWDQSVEKLKLRDHVELTLGTHGDLRLWFNDVRGRIAYVGPNEFQITAINTLAIGYNDNDGVYGETAIVCYKNGAVKIRHDNSQKFTTDAGGVTITGKMTSDTITTALSLEMFASSGHNYISSQSSGSNLYIRNTGGGQILIRPKTGEEGIKLIPDGAVELYWNNLLRLSTTDIGVHIDDYLSTDHINMSGELNFIGNGSKYIDVFTLANSNTFNIRHHNPSGNAFQTAFQSAANGGTTLYHSGNAKFATTTDGIQLYGNGYIDLPDNGRARFGQSQDLAIYHTTTGPNSYIDNITGDLFIRNNSNDCVIIGHNANKGLIYCPDGRVELRFNDVKKFETTSAGVDVSGEATIGYTTNSGHKIGSKSYSVTQTFSTGLTVTLGNHKACHVKIFISGDWSNHSSIAYVGEFFIQNADNNSSTFNEPGLIISEHDNLKLDGILSKIVDGTSDAFEIQFRANTNSATSVSARLCYHVMGDASAVS